VLQPVAERQQPRLAGDGHHRRDRRLSYTQEPLSHPIAGQYEKLDRPFLLHEYCWWTSLPELSLKDRYVRLPYQLNGIPEMEASAAKSGLSDQLPTFVDRSRRLKHELQRCGLEMARRNARISGYHYWLIHGLSWCQEGILNEFYDEPSDELVEMFRRVNGDTALLLADETVATSSAARRRPWASRCRTSAQESCTSQRFSGNWRNRDRWSARVPWHSTRSPVDRSRGQNHWGCRCRRAPIRCCWSYASGSSTAAQRFANNRWKLWVLPRPQGGAWAARIATDLPLVAKAYRVGRLAVSLNADCLKSPVVVTSRLNPALIDYLEQGGKVVLFSSGALKDSRPGAEFRPGQRITNDWTAMCDVYRTAP